MTQTAEVQEVKKNKNKAVPPSDPLNPVGIRLPEGLRLSLEAEADDRGISLGELCRQLIEAGHQDDPDRERKKLLRSLATIEDQVKLATDQGLIRHGWLTKRHPFMVAIEELREELNAHKDNPSSEPDRRDVLRLKI